VTTAVAERQDDPRWVAVRRIALATYAIVLAISVKEVGVPIGHDTVLLWAGAGLLCACIGRPWRSIPQLLIDWVPFVAVVIAYDYSRAWADTAGFGVHYTPQITADKLLFFGHVPTEWLETHLYHTRLVPVFTGDGFGISVQATGHVHWYEVLFDVTYVTHYLASFVLAGVLWVRARARFQWYARRFCLLSAMGFVTYVLFPAAPPWLAAQDGYLSSTVGRVGGRGFSLLHLDVVRNAIEDGSKLTNFVAAVPSLHAGFATLVVITLWRSVPRWVRPILALYPALMGLTLVATGEHYVIDILLGVAYAFAACAIWNVVERWWTARRDAAKGDVSPRSEVPLPV